MADEGQRRRRRGAEIARDPAPSTPPAAPPPPPPPTAPPDAPPPPPPAAPPPPPPPPPPAAAAPEPGPAPARRRRIPDWLDAKAVIAVLIGIVSVTGAVATWRSAVLGEQATDKDRQAVAETALQERNEANSEVQLRSEADAFARYRAGLVLAQQLDVEAEELRGQGLEAEAQEAENQAEEQRQVADTLALNTFNTAYVEFDEAGIPVAFDEERRRADLLRLDQEAARVDPEQTVVEADRLRNQSQRLVGWIVVFVAAIVLLTLAQIVTLTKLRPPLIALGAVVYLVATVSVFVAD